MVANLKKAIKLQPLIKAQKEKSRKIKPDFYQNTDTVQIAKKLLGKYLFTCLDGHLTGGRIVETEAYLGIQDKASHSYGGKKTPRNSAMFAAGGIAYIYFCYGMHYLFNAVTCLENDPQAVLVRAIEPLEGLKTMLKRRKLLTVSYRLTSGPGALAQALGLSLKQNGCSLQSDSIWLEEPVENNVNAQDIICSPRVGVAYAGQDAFLPWRFRLKGNPWCSRAK